VPSFCTIQLARFLINYERREKYQSYSAVSTRSSILEFTSSKIRFSAVFLLSWNSFVAFRTIGPPAEVEERALMRRISSSRQAVSKYSRLMRICTIWPRYWEFSRSTRILQTCWLRRWSSAYSMSAWFVASIGDTVPS
jgi:hypothetical protein